MKKLLRFEYVFYLSLLLGAIFLYQADYFRPVEIQSYPALAASLGCLAIAMYALVAAWQALLRSSGLDISYRPAFISINLIGLAKYIPGKVVLLHGVTAYLKDYHDMGRKRVAAVFVLYNLSYILTGLLIGAFILPSLDDRLRLLYVIGAIAGVLVLVFFNRLLRLGLQVARRLKPDLPMPQQAIKVDAISLIWFGLIWVCLGAGAYLLMVSLLGSFPSLSLLFAFPLSASLSNLVVISPGGLGVRESLLGLLLAQQGLSTGFAATFSALSRLWFLAGEIGVFLIAWRWHQVRSRQS